MILVLNKPYGMLSQFTPEPGSTHRTLAELGLPPDVYAVGRLDADSEGLLLLSDEGSINARLLDPDERHARRYWAQVEGIPSGHALDALERGVVIGGRKTMPCTARILSPQPTLEERDPPVRMRKHIPTTWIELVLMEGKNRQVRRMTAAVGHPTLRLLRVSIGGLSLGDLPIGHWRILTPAERILLFR